MVFYSSAREWLCAIYRRSVGDAIERRGGAMRQCKLVDAVLREGSRWIAALE